MSLFSKATLGRLPKGEAWDRIRQSPNFKNGRFRNPIPAAVSVNPIKVMREYRQLKKKDRKPKKAVPVHFLNKNDFSAKPSIPLKINWLGHATLIIELEGKRILIDPVLSERASPIDWAGVKRLHPCPLKIEDLPPLDLILISHCHYDHLDYRTIKKIKGKKTPYLLPLALGATLKYWGVQGAIHEVDWHQSFLLEKIKITATPARHFTQRSLNDANKTLWASWVIEGENQSLYYGGDSGFFPGYKDIGEQYGPFDLSMLGIGAYNDQWAGFHTTPEEAIEAHQLLNAKKMLPIHWATFDLAPHTWEDPIERFVKEAKQKNIQGILPEIGEWVEVESYHKTIPWWR